MDNKELLNKIQDILLKKAEGYFYSEETSEYTVQEDKDEQAVQLSFDSIGKRKAKSKSQSLSLTRKKVSTHHIPPDLAAIKMLLEMSQTPSDDFSKLSTEELEKLKDQLIDELKNL